MNIEVCIHHQLDLFGFQELFSEELSPLCTQSVVCLQPNSIIISIEKSDLNIHIRRNPVVFKMLIESWDKLVEQRIKQQQLTGESNLGPEAKPEQKAEAVKYNQRIRREIEEIQRKSISSPLKEAGSESPTSIKLKPEP